MHKLDHNCMTECIIFYKLLAKNYGSLFLPQNKKIKMVIAIFKSHNSDFLFSHNSEKKIKIKKITRLGNQLFNCELKSIHFYAMAEIIFHKKCKTAGKNVIQ